ncbi:WhiB family transcriptional regulator [Streptomyces sp. ISL-43]|nr:WhiB family transcriptional regulator [Streptomyces sp. ISL-43]
MGAGAGDDNAWDERAVCRTADPEELFVEGAAQNRAKAVCSGCFWRGEVEPMGRWVREPRCCIRGEDGHRHRSMIGGGNESRPDRVTSRWGCLRWRRDLGQ